MSSNRTAHTMSSTKKIQLMDTTLRDGEQTQGVSFTPPEKANIAKTLLKKLRVDRIEVTSARISEGELSFCTKHCRLGCGKWFFGMYRGFGIHRPQTKC